MLLTLVTTVYLSVLDNLTDQASTLNHVTPPLVLLGVNSHSVWTPTPMPSDTTTVWSQLVTRTPCSVPPTETYSFSSWLLTQ